MDSGSRLRRDIIRVLSLLLLAGLLVSCDFANPFSTSPVPTATRASGSGPVTITAANVSRLVQAWSNIIGGTAQFSIAPTVADGIIYIGSVNHHIDGSEIDTLYALDAASGKERWSYSTGGMISSTPVVTNGVVYITSGGSTYGSSNLNALDARTGTKLWTYNTGATTGFSTNPTVANGVVYISSGSISSGGGGVESTILYALSATSGTKVWSYDMMGSGFTVETSVVANGVIYIDSRSDGKLSALDAKSGTSLWNHFTGGSLETDISATNNMVYAASLKTLYAFGSAIQVATPTAISSSSHGTTQPLAPSINNAPVFADIPGLHIQSTDGLQCPLSHGIGIPLPADDSSSRQVV